MKNERLQEAEDIYKCVCHLGTMINENTDSQIRLYVSGLKDDTGRHLLNMHHDEQDRVRAERIKRRPMS